MKNNFTKEDIKNSVEYVWRKNTVTWLFVTSTIVAVVMFIATLIPALTNIRHFSLAVDIWLSIIAFYTVTLVPFVAFYGYKMSYLLKHFTEFNSYEVMLDYISTSYAYRGAIYYTVTINDDGVTSEVNTNPYFSSALFSKFTLEDYNNKKVVGLYDSKMDKFYIVKKVG